MIGVQKKSQNDGFDWPKKCALQIFTLLMYFTCVFLLAIISMDRLGFG